MTSVHIKNMNCFVSIMHDEIKKRSQRAQGFSFRPSLRIVELNHKMSDNKRRLNSLRKATDHSANSKICHPPAFGCLKGEWPYLMNNTQGASPLILEGH